VLSKKIGDKVSKGDVIARIYCDNAEKTKEAETMIKDAYTFSQEYVEKNVLIKGIVG
jgi:pyrimidine-nucleoside phosphorylase